MVNKYLYRGDSDKNSVRNLRTTAPHGYLMTNLNNGGNGRIINEQPLIDLIDQHVVEGWNTTHFLSFSEDESTAFCFGMNSLDCSPEERERYIDISWNENWDFVMTRISPASLSLKEISNSVYIGTYKTLNPLYARLIPKSRLILGDVVNFLRNSEGFETAKSFSADEKEWLILPANRMQNIDGKEYSSILEGGCIDDIKFYGRIENTIQHML
ncbi:MAG: hypothetical protein MJA30_27175 [Cytophagales bacterium]|nr:hypothetical protein [Cytophagales bacterium]